MLSAVLTALGGVAYAQYIAYVNPDTLSGIGVSLRIVFAVVLGGMYALLGPTVGTALTIALSRVPAHRFGLKLIGMAETIYGLLLIVFIIFLPAGIYGSLARAGCRGARRARGGAGLTDGRRAWASSVSIPPRSRRRRPARWRAGRAGRRPRAGDLPGAASGTHWQIFALLPLAQGGADARTSATCRRPTSSGSRGGQEARALRRSDRRGVARPGRVLDAERQPSARRRSTKLKAE